MTKDEAERTLEALLAAHGVRAELDLDWNKVGGVMLGAAELFFEYEPEGGALRCSALIYRFRREPKPAVLEAFELEEKSTDTGGGRLEYRPESRSLFLSRAYTQTVSDADFARDMKRLADASLVWAGEVAGRAADRAFQPKTQD